VSEIFEKRRVGTCNHLHPCVKRVFSDLHIQDIVYNRVYNPVYNIVYNTVYHKMYHIRYNIVSDILYNSA